MSRVEPVEIVLVDPEIPPNTGNVGRTCVGLGLPLVLAGTPAFSLDDTQLRRAGLDYWPKLNLRLEPDRDAYLARLAARRPVVFTKHAETPPWELDLTAVDALCFGSETQGLPAEWLEAGFVQSGFPQTGEIRSYNLATCVHTAAMEWARQTGWRP